MTDLDTLRRRLESLLEDGRPPLDPEVLAVSRELDKLVAAEMKKAASGCWPKAASLSKGISYISPNTRREG